MNFLAAICMIFYRPKPKKVRIDKVHIHKTATASENPKGLPVVELGIVSGVVRIVNYEELFKGVKWGTTPITMTKRIVTAWLPFSLRDESPYESISGEVEIEQIRFSHPSIIKTKNTTIRVKP